MSIVANCFLYVCVCVCLVCVCGGGGRRMGEEVRSGTTVLLNIMA